MHEDGPETRPGRRRGRPSEGGREAVLAATTALIAEVGASRLTTREVSRRSGISEGGIFYHFKDRAGLMGAVIEHGLDRFSPLIEPGGLQLGALHQNLTTFATLTDEFLDAALPVMIAAQSDATLRDRMRGYMLERNMGPHRGITIFAQYLLEEQSHGHVPDDVDCSAVAYLFYGACFQRATQRLFFGESYEQFLPSRDAVIATVERLLAST